MPPSPQDVKSRLDKVVDQEGNVLDMGTVLDIVSVLERITITKEALETTRLGRIINLMRKKTDNEELARRAKKLVKKWQKLVSNHFKNLSRAVDSPCNVSRISTPTPQINGIVKESGTLPERQKPSNEIPLKTGIKRKQVDESTECLHGNERINSDFTEASEKESQETNLIQHGSGINESQKTGENNCATTLIRNGRHKSISNSELEELSTSDKLLPDVSRLKSLNDEQIIEPFTSMEKTNELEINRIEILSNANVDTLHDTEVKALHDENISVRLVSPDANLNPPTNIPEEDLIVRRKPFSDDCNDITSQSDGVNGCYDENYKWCSWTESVVKKDGNMSILPYVTLD